MNMNKRITIIGFMVCLLLVFIACKTENGINDVSEVVNSETETISEQLTENISDEVEEVYVSDFEPQVIYDQDGLKVVARRYFSNYTDEEDLNILASFVGVPLLELEVTNETEYECTIWPERLFINEISYDNFDYNMCIEEESVSSSSCEINAGDTRIVYVDWGQMKYYSEKHEDTMDVSIIFSIYTADVLYHANALTFNTVYPVYPNPNYECREQYNMDNIIYENDDFIVYLVSAKVEEGYDKEDLYDDTFECILLIESKQFTNQLPTEGTLFLSLGDSLLYLSEQQAIDGGSAKISKKTFVRYTVYDIAWEDIQKGNVYSIGYEESIFYGYNQDTGIMNEDIIDEGFVDIPVSSIEYIKYE